MPAMRKMVLATVATVVLVSLPIRPAAAVGPLFFAPWALGHIVLPLIAASAAASQPAASYAPGPAYYAGAPRNYYVPPQGYYGPPPAYYPPAYYRPAVVNTPVAGPFYAPPRGYYQPRPSYYGAYGGQGYSRTRGYGYRRW
jgi:hypothetical protein